MSLTDLDISNVTYQSYASLAEANGILGVDPVRMTAWAALSDMDKEIRLIASTERLDLLSWRGERTGGLPTQQRAWPRTGLFYENGAIVLPDVIPHDLERATALLAGSITSRPANSDQGTSAQAISKIKAGSVQLDYFRRAGTVEGEPLQDETALVLIRKWLESGISIAVGVATGTTETSSFLDRDRYDRRY